jgi:hypothetical protein
MNERIDYATHILIGIKKAGDMIVVAHWPHVPRQAPAPAGNGTPTKGRWGGVNELVARDLYVDREKIWL